MTFAPCAWGEGAEGEEAGDCNAAALAAADGAAAGALPKASPPLNKAAAPSRAC